MSLRFLNKEVDPIPRTSSPSQLGPISQILAKRTGNYHSTSLRLPTMVTVNTVNKTALHPGKPCLHPNPSRLADAVLFQVVFSTCVPAGNENAHTSQHANLLDRPVKEHTELEEELHENAHIDYDRVAIVRFPPSVNGLGQHH